MGSLDINTNNGEMPSLSSNLTKSARKLEFRFRHWKQHFLPLIYWRPEKLSCFVWLVDLQSLVNDHTFVRCSHLAAIFNGNIWNLTQIKQLHCSTKPKDYQKKLLPDTEPLGRFTRSRCHFIDRRFSLKLQLMFGEFIRSKMFSFFSAISLRNTSE